MTTTWDTYLLIYMGTTILSLTIVCSSKHTPFPTSNKLANKLEVLQRFKVAHKPLVKTLSNFENMESHGESIKPVLCQLITSTPLKEKITLLKFFGGIGTGLETLL
jgi:hypothetical protein